MRIGKDLRFSFPHVLYSGLIDESGSQNATGSGPNAGVLLSGFFAGKGVDSMLTKYTDLSSFIEDYGRPNTNKFGIMHQHIYNWLQGGGHAVVCSLKPEDAAVSNVVLSTNITKEDGAFCWIQSTGDITFESTEAGEDGKPVTLKLLKLELDQRSFNDVQSMAELNVEVTGIADKTITDVKPALIPLDSIIYAGRTNYGDNISINLETSGKNVGLFGTPVKNMSVYDAFENDNIHTGYPVSSQEDAILDGVLKTQLSDAINEYIPELNALMLDSHRLEADGIFETHLKEMKAAIEALITAGTIDGIALTEAGEDKLDAIVADIDKLLLEFDTGLDIAYINRLPIFGGESTEDVYNRFYKCGDLSKITLKNGSNGSLTSMRKFDWNFSTGEGEAKVNHVQQLLSDFYNGVITKDIYDVVHNNADVIVDVGFPLTVQNACSGLNAKRDEITFLTSCPISLDTPEKVKTWIGTWNPHNPAMLKVVNHADYADPITNKVARYPITFFMTNVLLSFFKNGYKTPISGQVIDGFVTGSLLPNYTSCEDEDLNLIYTKNCNYLSPRDSISYYLDGQMTNDNMNDQALGKEFHNRVIASRIAKKFYVSLSMKKHLLDEPGGIDKVRGLLTDEADEFANKVDKIETKLYFAKPIDEIMGFYTFEVTTYPYGTVKGYKFRQIMRRKDSK